MRKLAHFAPTRAAAFAHFIHTHTLPLGSHVPLPYTHCSAPTRAALTLTARTGSPPAHPTLTLTAPFVLFRIGSPHATPPHNTLSYKHSPFRPLPQRLSSRDRFKNPVEWGSPRCYQLVADPDQRASPSIRFQTSSSSSLSPSPSFS